MRIFAALVNKNAYNREEYFLYELINNQWKSLMITSNDIAYSKDFILKHVAETYPVYIIKKPSLLNNFDIEEGDLDERLH